MEWLNLEGIGKKLAKKLAFFSKINVMMKFFHNFALF
jgi:hypothetical protein